MPRQYTPKIARVCPICGTTFHRYACQLVNGRGVYCSKPCGYKAQQGRGLVARVCEECGAAFQAQRYSVANGNARFCSRRCGARHRLPDNRVERACGYCGAAMLVFPSNLRWGFGKFCSHACHDSSRRKLNQTDRWSWHTKNWRRRVYERDNYTCQQCGIRGIRLNAHHRRGWADHPEGRFDVDNGVTLCVPCHNAIHGNAPRSA